MKHILEKILNNQNHFKCKWNGEEVGCTILQIDFSRNLAFVRFDKPVKKTITTWVDQPFSYDVDPQQIPVDKEIETQEEWIAI